MSFQQQLSDERLGAKIISLALSRDTPNPLEGVPVVVTCDYSRALPEGVVLPVLIEVYAPDSRKIVERTISRVLPASLDFTPDVGGPHLVRIVEMAHNLWCGVLQVDVEGDEQRSE